MSSIHETIDHKNGTAHNETVHLTDRAEKLFYMLTRELVYRKSIPQEHQDDVYISLRYIVTELSTKFSPAFHQLKNASFLEFTTAAREIFRKDGESSDTEFSWARTGALFLLGICVVNSFSEEDERANDVGDWMRHAVARYVIPTIKSIGGWESLLIEYPVDFDNSQEDEPRRIENQRGNPIILSSVVLPLCLAGIMVYFRHR